MKYLKKFNENFGQKGMFDWKTADMRHTPSSRKQLGLDDKKDGVCKECECLIVNDKKVKDFSKNEDSSFNVEFEDSTKTIIYVSHDDWDKLNDSMLKESFEDQDDEESKPDNWWHPHFDDNVEMDETDIEDCYAMAYDKIDKMLPDDPELQKEFYEIIDSEDEITTKYTEMEEFFVINIDEDRFDSYCKNGNLKDFATYVVQKELNIEEDYE
jgi:hypothetical protein